MCDKVDIIEILDGGLGTMLQSAGLPSGMNTALFSFEAPEVVLGVHRAYAAAGAGILFTNTFGVNRYKLADTSKTVGETVALAVRLCRQAAEETGARVALDVGPIGELMEPLGALTFDEAYDTFREIITAGVEAEVDIIVFETFTSLNELRVALLAAKESCELPVFVSMSFEENGRTFTGDLPESLALVAEALGADAVGVNCSCGPEKLMGVVERMHRTTALPLFLKPNAGIPDPSTGKFDLTPEDFAAQMRDCVRLGVKYAGGCCGTTPAHISALSAALDGLGYAPSEASGVQAVCSPGCVCLLSEPRIIGERLNPTGKKRFREALTNGDMDYIITQGVQQLDAGADILDVNVGVPGLDEKRVMRETVTAVASVIDLPLQIDSNDPAVIEAGLRAFCGRAIVNSVNGEAARLEAVLPLVRRYGAMVVGLTSDEGGIPEKAEDRLKIAEKIVSAAEKQGISRDRVIIDCLCLAASASESGAAETLRAIRLVKDTLGVKTILGVSNVSFGLPEREQINKTFLAMALCAGLDLAIINPNCDAVMEAFVTAKMLNGQDVGCENYIALFADRGAVSQAVPVEVTDIAQAVSKGLKAEARALCSQLLQSCTEEEIIEKRLIPALDEVGARYERGEIFLPQLIRSADAAGAAFDTVRDSIAAKNETQPTRGRIILATVKGDMHDIGKNIVRSILSNYGYEVIDLGRDVPPEAVVRAAIEKDVKLVGLSALMTTTLGAMEETIRALRASGHRCSIVVGGAVLTPEYAREIGADYYARDAKQSADIAKKVFGQEERQ